MQSPHTQAYFIMLRVTFPTAKGHALATLAALIRTVGTQRSPADVQLTLQRGGINLCCGRQGHAVRIEVLL